MNSWTVIYKFKLDFIHMLPLVKMVHYIMETLHLKVKNTCPLLTPLPNPKQTRGVSHCGFAIYIKEYLKAKEEELWKLKYFTIAKI